MKKLLFINLFLLTFLNSCNSQTLERVNEKSKLFTRKARNIMDSVYVLRKHNDTLKYLQAISFLDSAIFYDSTNYYASWKESEYFFDLKKYNEALMVISKYTKSHKNNIIFLLREAYLYDKIGDTTSAKVKYNYILNWTNEGLKQDTTNKKLMIIRYCMLLLLEDSRSTNYLIEIKNKFSGDKEFNNLVIFSKNFNKNKFLDYQLSGGTSEDIQNLR